MHKGAEQYEGVEVEKWNLDQIQVELSNNEKEFHERETYETSSRLWDIGVSR